MTILLNRARNGGYVVEDDEGVLCATESVVEAMQTVAQALGAAHVEISGPTTYPTPPGGSVRMAMNTLARFKAGLVAAEADFKEWAGGERPISAAATVCVLHRSGRMSTGDAGQIDWTRGAKPRPEDVVAYSPGKEGSPVKGL